MLYTPLSNEGHISAMMGGMNACGWLSHLEVCKLLQCEDQVVCPEGLNGGLEPLWLTYQESCLWNTADPSKLACKLSLIQVNLSSVRPRDEMPIT